MAYLDSTGLSTLWAKIKATFGANLDISTASTTVDIKLKNKAATPADLDTITIPAATDSKAGVMTAAEHSKLDGIDSQANKYVHPTTSGNKHIPSGGQSGKILKWSADGTAEWGDETGATLYSGTGQNTDGAMTQKAATDTFLTSHQDITGKADKATTLAGYGITDAKIASGVITLGSDSITPLTSHQDITGKADKATSLSGYGITDAYTKTEVDAKLAGAARYKGTLASEVAFTALTNYKQGDYYVVSTSWTSTSLGITLDAGNMIFCNSDYSSAFSASDFDVIQADIEAIPDSVINALS